MSPTAETPVFGFMYQCQETNPLSDDLIDEILEVSRRNNASRGITGVLLYRGGRFLQVLEGDRDKVMDLIQTIRRDPRQKAFTVLYESQWPRLFGQWSMDFRKLENKPANSLYNTDEAIAHALTRAPLRVRKRLVTFAAGC